MREKLSSALARGCFPVSRGPLGSLFFLRVGGPSLVRVPSLPLPSPLAPSLIATLTHAPLFLYSFPFLSSPLQLLRLSVLSLIRLPSSLPRSFEPRSFVTYSFHSFNNCSYLF